MDVTSAARDHLFATIDRQYEHDDAEALKALLSATSSEQLATKQDIADLRIEFKDALHQETRSFIAWMFGLLTVYTAMAGTFVAIGTILLTR